jgi:hypothetical protein
VKNKLVLYYIILILLAGIIIIFCHSEKTNIKKENGMIEKIKTIRKKNIYFGHKSVGENIISGLHQILDKYGQDEYSIKSLNDSQNFERINFLHSDIGNNGEPKGKFAEFSKIVNGLVSKKLEIAMMKLCFVDITEKTNINDIFASYVEMIDSLKRKHPDLVIIHFTVPLKSNPSLINNIKNIIKGRTSNDVKDNLTRNKYNELLYSKYSKQDIFDIAKIESMHPDGKRESLVINGQICYCLVDDYTNDGGHLNELGQNIVASGLISKLCEVINSSENIKSNNYKLVNRFK